MGTWGLIQLVVDIFFALGLFIVVMRVSRQPKDDPRLSRGLQLLQAKIAVLEDLSDRTESQVQQMTSLLEQKGREIQNKIQLADRHVQLIRSAMDRSLEVAKIFQDKIPHQEVIERQNTIKYLQAARMAHKGKSVEEIAQIVDLPKGEIEFISKVNREQLMFSEDQLPDWAREGNPALGLTTEAPSENGIGAEEARRIAVAETTQLSKLATQQELVESLQQVQREMNEMFKTEGPPRDLSEAFSVPPPPTESLARLGEEFRKARAESEVPGVNTIDGLSFVELKPDAPLTTPTNSDVNRPFSLTNPMEAQNFLENDLIEDDPLLDLTPEEIEGLKKSIYAELAQNAAVPSASAPVQMATPVASSPVAAPVSPADPRAQALAQARAAAQDLKRPQPRTAVQSQLNSTVPASTPSAAKTTNAPTQPVIRKVEFPRITVKPTDNLG
ncbi:MAG: DUF2802 domain-containing protein [Bdellovibrionaceae bacterium]|nr:DUF2802 domain-containing protein [Pseudobdellovibrionaceae bacterium]